MLELVTIVYVKAVDPLELTEYAVTRNIQNESVFAWWFSNTFRTRKRIISRLKSAMMSKGTTIVEAEKMDVLNGNKF